jgi:hypothetical protein
MKNVCRGFLTQEAPAPRRVANYIYCSPPRLHNCINVPTLKIKNQFLRSEFTKYTHF